MKKSALVLLAGLSLSLGNVALADSSNQWICSASGDTSNLIPESVFGDYSDTQELAQNSALDTCQEEGYILCSIDTCFPPANSN